MFSYQHGYHAGNHADVLKHLILIQLLNYYRQKEKGFYYIDTHAGAGSYSLKKGFAAKTTEYESGIAKLWHYKGSLSCVTDYLDAVKEANPNGKLHFYPGSPQFAWQNCRAQDKMRLYELHPREITALREHFISADKRLLMSESNGFDGLKAILPPSTRRGLILIDPSYEDKEEMARVITALNDSLKRFATGTYMVWFPKTAKMQFAPFLQKLKTLNMKNWLHASLTVSAPPIASFGLFGSDIFIINPPFTLHQQLNETLPFLAQSLGIDSEANFSLEVDN